MTLPGRFDLQASLPAFLPTSPTPRPHLINTGLARAEWGPRASAPAGKETCFLGQWPEGQTWSQQQKTGLKGLLPQGHLSHRPRSLKTVGLADSAAGEHIPGPPNSLLLPHHPALQSHTPLSSSHLSPWGPHSTAHNTFHRKTSLLPGEGGELSRILHTTPHLASFTSH